MCFTEIDKREISNKTYLGDEFIMFSIQASWEKIGQAMAMLLLSEIIQALTKVDVVPSCFLLWKSYPQTLFVNRNMFRELWV